MRRTLLTVLVSLFLAAAAALAAFVPAPSSSVDPAGVSAFQSPTGNIGCVVDATAGARCDIRSKAFKPPRRPRACTLGYGQGLIVEKRGRGHFVCAGDTALNSGRRVPYGGSVTVGRFTCEVAQAGVTCTNRSSNHGFTLSRAVYLVR